MPIELNLKEIKQETLEECIWPYFFVWKQKSNGFHWVSRFIGKFDIIVAYVLSFLCSHLSVTSYMPDTTHVFYTP